jgi:hypothetical protein
MAATTLITLLAVATVGAGLWRAARIGRCSCQRDDPLAGLGALGAVTSRVRREERTGPSEGGDPRRPLRPVPFPAGRQVADPRRPSGLRAVPTRHRPRGASPCP